MTVTRDEFYKIYKEKFEPVLLPLEPGRKALAKKGAMLLIIVIIINAVAFLLSDYISILPFLSMGLSVVAIFWYKKNMDKYRAELKKSVMSKILSLFGNIYFSGKRNLIRLNTIKNFGLFRSASAKTDDDIVIGLYNGCNFLINECLMTHSEGSGKHSRTVTDFRGFIFQVSMNKPFSGRTIVGVNGDIDKLPGFEEVKLESVEFMKGRKIYATDQIEARYILTTSFMERFDNLGKSFFESRVESNISASGIDSGTNPVRNDNSFVGRQFAAMLERSTRVSAAFIGGYAYIFVPCSENLFDVDMTSTLLNPEAYYNIYNQLSAILEIIDYMKLNQKIGL